MAGQIKRLRRKTTVSQSACSELLLLTSEWWMQFVLPLGRYEPRVYAIFWMKKWRLLCKAWREVWDQGFRVRLFLHEDHVGELCYAGGSYGDLMFYRDSCNKVEYFQCGRRDEGLKCRVSMPWNTFKRLRPILSRMAMYDGYLRPRGKSFNVHSFVQTAFCLQSEL